VGGWSAQLPLLAILLPLSLPPNGVAIAIATATATSVSVQFPDSLFSCARATAALTLKCRKTRANRENCRPPRGKAAAP